MFTTTLLLTLTATVDISKTNNKFQHIFDSCRNVILTLSAYGCRALTSPTIDLMHYDTTT